MAKEIVLIDDKEYGIEQIRNAIPQGKKQDFPVVYFSMYAQYKILQDQKNYKPYIVLLDFFLDKDMLFGDAVAHNIQTEILIGFSSELDRSEKIIQTVKQHKLDKRPLLYAVKKIKNTHTNEELNKLFTKICI